MEWLDDDGSTASLESAPAAETHAPMWPIVAVLVLTAVGTVVAVWTWFAELPVLALVTYAVLLLAGCGLLWYQRFTAITVSRRAGGSGVLTISGLEKSALAALVFGCVANGVVVAVWIARMAG